MRDRDRDEHWGDEWEPEPLPAVPLWPPRPLPKSDDEHDEESSPRMVIIELT